MAEIPGAKTRLGMLLRQAFTWDALQAITGMVAAIFVAKHFYDEEKFAAFTVAVCFAVLSGGIGLCKSISQLIGYKETNSPHSLEGCLHTLHALSR